MSAFIIDFRVALRGFSRRPGTTALIFAMLALGIGAAAAAFSLVNALFLRPLPFPEADRLLDVNEAAPAYGATSIGVSYADFLVWRNNARAFETMGAWFASSHTLSTADQAERLEGALVTHDLTAALGVDPVLGRAFQPDEEEVGGPAVVMISESLWSRRFGSSPDVVGRSVRVDGAPHTIVGVMPASVSLLGTHDIWLPIQYDSARAVNRYTGQAVARMNAGVTIDQARADLQSAHSPIWESRDPERTILPEVLPLKERLVGDFRLISVALAGAAALVLLIACANVSSILLARSFTRRRELSLRYAVGARRRRIAGQLMTESLALSILAAPAGLAVGVWTTRFALATIPEQVPSWVDPGVDWRVALFAVGLVGLSAVAFGLAPLARSVAADFRGAFSEGDHRSGSSRHQRRWLQSIVVVEITTAALLLVGTGLLLRSLGHLGDVDPGYRTEDVLTFRVALPDASYSPGQERFSFYHELLDRVENLPGVLAAGAITCPPLDCFRGRTYEAEGAVATDAPLPIMLFQATSPGYLEAMGIRVVSGRFLESEDGLPGANPAVVLDETAARALFPGVSDPVGRRIRQRTDDPLPWITVVGVVGDARYTSFDQPARPVVYFPIESEPLAALAVTVRTAIPPASVVPGIREIVSEIDRELPLFQVTTMAESVARSMRLRVAYSSAITVLSATALMLALVGVNGVVSFIVEQRRREFGIRMALGATGGRLRRVLVRDAMEVACVGLAIGLTIAFLGGRVLGGLVVGVRTDDLLTFAVVALVLTTTAMISAMVPARRVVRTDPAVILNDE